MVVEYYTVTADNLVRKYLCGSPAVAANRFLNYVRLYRKERPKKLEISIKSGKKFEATASWYFGKLKKSSFKGAKGEWYELEDVKRQ